MKDSTVESEQPKKSYLEYLVDDVTAPGGKKTVYLDITKPGVKHVTRAEQSMTSYAILFSAIYAIIGFFMLGTLIVIAIYMVQKHQILVLGELFFVAGIGDIASIIGLTGFVYRIFYANHNRLVCESEFDRLNKKSFLMSSFAFLFLVSVPLVATYFLHSVGVMDFAVWAAVVVSIVLINRMSIWYGYTRTFVSIVEKTLKKKYKNGLKFKEMKEGLNASRSR